MPKRLPPILTAHTAKKLLDGKNEVSLDMGLTTTKIKRTKNAIMFPSGENIDYGSLEKIAEKENAAYFVSGENVYQVATSGKHFYKLVPTPGAPTLEIDGIRMHRTKDTTPDVDAREKLSILGLDGGYVLDTCMGLGYTAAEARRKGAEKVVTVELEPSVVHISALNPWSRDVFEDPDIHKILGDSFTLVGCLPDGFFDYVIHDPPRHGHAGRLYGSEFYHRLFDVLRQGGRLFHYTGEPRSRYRGVSLQRGVSRRLRAAGFREVEYHPTVMGVTASR
jgi:predicted methyltransferase